MPATLDKDQAMKLAGSAWDPSYEAFFNKFAEEGHITREQVIKALDDTQKQAEGIRDPPTNSDPKTAQVGIAKLPSTTQREPLLQNHAFDRVKQAEGIRVLMPGRTQRLVEIDAEQYMNFGSEAEIVRLIRQIDPGLLPPGAQLSLYIHNSSLQHLTDRAYEPLRGAVKWDYGPAGWKTREDKLPGCKLRVLDDTRKDATVEHVEMRGVPLREVEKFHTTYKGATSRLKQGRLLMPYMLVGGKDRKSVV